MKAFCNIRITEQCLASADALRGLDMFVFVGIRVVFPALMKWSDIAFFNSLANQYKHTEWHGFKLSLFYWIIYMKVYKKWAFPSLSPE